MLPCDMFKKTKSQGILKTNIKTKQNNTKILTNLKVELL